VVDAVSQPGGFSPGLASRLVLANGRRVFAKAISQDRNQIAWMSHRREAETLEALPPIVPAPRLLGIHDEDGWVAIVTEDVGGRTPAQPWRPDELDRVLAAAADLAELLTPSPVATAPVGERFGEFFNGWRKLSAAGDVEGLEPWARDNLDRLATVEAQWTRTCAGDSLMHGDLRADNVLLTQDRVVFVDWPRVCSGAAWLDLLLMLPSVALHGPPPAETWSRYRLSTHAAPEAVTAAIVAQAGYFTFQSRQPAPANVPRLRVFQAAQARASVAWARQRSNAH
jgi:aminoglycoside phosphotransferase (APT) family kinase protein